MRISRLASAGNNVLLDLGRNRSSHRRRRSCRCACRQTSQLNQRIIAASQHEHRFVALEGAAIEGQMILDLCHDRHRQLAEHRIRATQQLVARSDRIGDARAALGVRRATGMIGDWNAETLGCETI